MTHSTVVEQVAGTAILLDRLAGEQPFGLFYTVDVTTRIKDWNKGRKRMSQLACNELINRQLYPIDDLENPKRVSTIAAVRHQRIHDHDAVADGGIRWSF